MSEEHFYLVLIKYRISINSQFKFDGNYDCNSNIDTI